MKVKLIYLCNEFLDPCLELLELNQEIVDQEVSKLNLLVFQRAKNLNNENEGHEVFQRFLHHCNIQTSQ